VDVGYRPEHAEEFLMPWVFGQWCAFRGWLRAETLRVALA
jgi:hypothetical protein